MTLNLSVSQGNAGTLNPVSATNFTTGILTKADSTNTTNFKKTPKIDKDQTLEKCALKPSLISQVATAGGTWSKLWDSALHLGLKHLKGLQNVNRIMAHHGRGSKPCPLCDTPLYC